MAARLNRLCRLTSVAAVLGVFGAGLVMSASPARADITFDGSATAVGFEMRVANPSFPLGLAIEGQAPLTRVGLTSLGSSTALASTAYPGELASTLPGTVSGTLGLPGLPSYPLVALASQGDEPQERSVPGAMMRAEAFDGRAAARAMIGDAAAGSLAQASVTRTTSDGVLAVAESTYRSVSLLELLEIDGAHTRVETHVDSFGERTSSSTLEISRISAAGLSISLPETTPDSAPPVPQLFPDQPALPAAELPPIPIPMGDSVVSGPTLSFADGQFTLTLQDDSLSVDVPFDDVAAAFEAAGFDLRYQEPRETDTGITGGVLVVSTVLPELPDNPGGLRGETTVTMVVGSGTTSVSSSTVPTTAAPSPMNLSTPANTAPQTTSSLSGGITSTGSGQAGSALGPGTATAIGEEAGGSELSTPRVAPSSDVGAPTRSGSTLAAAPGHLSGLDIAGLYWLLVATAAASLAGTAVMRSFGMRTS